MLMDKQRILLMMGTFIFLLASFRASNVEDAAVNYFVPGYIAMTQRLSLPLIGLLMVASIMLNIARPDKIVLTGIPVGLLCFFIFQLIVVITAFAYKGDLQDLLVRGTFIVCTFFYFSTVVRTLPLHGEGSTSVLVHVFLGISSFVAVNVFLHLYPGANVMWKGRLFGVTGHPNFLGMCTAIGWIMAAGLYFDAENNRTRILFFTIMLLCIYGSILTGSRTSILSGTLGTATIWWFSMRDERLKPLFVLCILLLGVLLSANLTLESLDFAGRGNTRQETWASMMERAAELPFFGYGRVGATTNAFLFAIVATGIFGSAFFFRSMIQLIRPFFAALPQFTTETINIIKGLTVFFLISSVFEGYLLDNVSLPVFTYWLLMTYIKF